MEIPSKRPFCQTTIKLGILGRWQMLNKIAWLCYWNIIWGVRIVLQNNLLCEVETNFPLTKHPYKVHCLVPVRICLPIYLNYNLLASFYTHLIFFCPIILCCACFIWSPKEWIQSRFCEWRNVTCTELDYSSKRNTVFLLYNQLANHGEWRCLRHVINSWYKFLWCYF